MGQLLSLGNENVLKLQAKKTGYCLPTFVLPNEMPNKLQGLISYEEWNITLQAINEIYKKHVHSRRPVTGFLVVLVVLLLTAGLVSPYAGIAILVVIGLTGMYMVKQQQNFRAEATCLVDRLNAEIYGGALLHIIRPHSRSQNRSPQPIYEVAIDLNRLQQYKFDSLSSVGLPENSTPSTLPHTASTPFYTHPPAVNPAAHPMPFYSHTNAKGSAPATATASVPYSYASGAAAPVVAEAFPVGALPQVTSTEVQKAHPSMSKMEQFVVVEVVVPAGAVPGSVLNVTLSDGRIVAVGLPPNVRPGQTIQVQVPAL